MKISQTNRSYFNRSAYKVIAFWLILWSICCPAEAGFLRVGTYNTFNNPDNTTEDGWFTTIFEAIGKESVNGFAKRLDILTVAETDLGSSARLPSILNSLYGVNTYQVIASTPDGGNDRTAVVYDSSTLSLLGSSILSTGLTHHSVRAEFRPIGTTGQADFYIYAIHLKSGSTSSDQAIRADEAALLRADADALGDGTHVIYTGDLNMLGISEGAWTNLTAAGNGQGFDLANAPGEWHDNPAFIHLHTQDPGGDMDDRFDFQLASDELLDGEGLDYVTGSYRVFGNNGTHFLNDMIDTGTGASPDVLSALISASDHLPVVADFVIPEPTAAALLSLSVFILVTGRGGMRT